MAGAPSQVEDDWDEGSQRRERAIAKIRFSRGNDKIALQLGNGSVWQRSNPLQARSFGETSLGEGEARILDTRSSLRFVLVQGRPPSSTSAKDRAKTALPVEG